MSEHHGDVASSTITSQDSLFPDSVVEYPVRTFHRQPQHTVTGPNFNERIANDSRHNLLTWSSANHDSEWNLDFDFSSLDDNDALQSKSALQNKTYESVYDNTQIRGSFIDDQGRYNCKSASTSKHDEAKVIHLVNYQPAQNLGAGWSDERQEHEREPNQSNQTVSKVVLSRGSHVVDNQKIEESRQELLNDSQAYPIGAKQQYEILFPVKCKEASNTLVRCNRQDVEGHCSMDQYPTTSHFYANESSTVTRPEASNRSRVPCGQIVSRLREWSSNISNNPINSKLSSKSFADGKNCPITADAISFTQDSLEQLNSQEQKMEGPSSNIGEGDAVDLDHLPSTGCTQSKPNRLMQRLLQLHQRFDVINLRMNKYKT